MNPSDPLSHGMPAPAGGGGSLLLDEPRESLYAALLRKLAGLRFFTFSALFHVILLVLVGGTVLFKHIEEVPDFQAGGEDGILSPQDAAQAPPEQAPSMSSTQSVSVTPAASASA